MILRKGGEMKLRNKRTNRIIEIDTIDDWEQVKDYEKSKEFWYITAWGQIREINPEEDLTLFPSRLETMKEIGNYFGTREEAEKAVEKLKAWKRLKDKGFRFLDHIDRDCGQGITRYEWNGYIDGEDLDLLFGGEE